MKTIEFESVLTNLVGIDKPIKMYKQKIYCDNNAVGVTIADYCRAVGLDFRAGAWLYEIFSRMWSRFNRD